MSRSINKVYWDGGMIIEMVTSSPSQRTSRDLCLGHLQHSQPEDRHLLALTSKVVLMPPPQVVLVAPDTGRQKKPSSVSLLT